MAANINVAERNTLPVLYNITFSTVISLHHQHNIIYIYNFYIYIYILYYNEATPRAQNEKSCGSPKKEGKHTNSVSSVKQS